MFGDTCLSKVRYRQHFLLVWKPSISCRRALKYGQAWKKCIFSRQTNFNKENFPPVLKTIICVIYYWKNILKNQWSIISTFYIKDRDDSVQSETGRCALKMGQSRTMEETNYFCIVLSFEQYSIGGIIGHSRLFPFSLSISLDSFSMFAFMSVAAKCHAPPVKCALRACLTTQSHLQKFRAIPVNYKFLTYVIHMFSAGWIFWTASDILNLLSMFCFS